MMDTIGFLGCGNMGGAIARAVCKAVDPKKVFLANRTAAKAQALAKELGCKTATNAEVAGDCDLIFLAVKPQMMEALLQPLKFTFDERPSRFVLCSMAAGLSIARIQEMAGEDFPVIRIMPNTPASVGEGMIQYCSSNVTAEEEEAFLRIMAPAGRLDAVPESLIDAASCVSGCGPAWVYQFIEALADGGVACGLPRAKAQEYAAQMVLGSAKLVLESGKHPGELKDAVCSPGGSTIQGVRVLEEHKQACAAVGQCELMYTYDRLFNAYNHTVAQILLTGVDVEHTERRVNFQNTLSRLLELGALPIINENDTVATDEITSIGDNDTLAAIVACCAKADLLVLLSDIDGLYTANPHTHTDAKLIPLVEEITPEVMALADGAGSALGTGGMATKLRAARMVTGSGADMVIANGAHPELLYDIAAGRSAGTRFAARKED